MRIILDNNRWILLLIIALFPATSVCQVEEGNYQGKLLDDLMHRYGSGVVRPVFNTSTTTTVIFRAKIHEVIELDSKHQRITVSANLKQVWDDEFIHWNQSEYGGISKIHLAYEQLWHPDISLHRNIDPDFERIKHTTATVLSNGLVTWFAPAIFTSSCRMYLRYFPFDIQVCELRLSSWSYTGDEIDLIHDVSNDSVQDSFLENGVWDLSEVHTYRDVHYYTCCPEPYPELIFKIVLKRRSTFYVNYLILPCVFLSVLSLLVFYLPAECGEKLTLSITNLLALVVFQQLVAESMPPSGEDPPLIGDYFLAMIVMVCVSVVTTVLVIHVAAKAVPVPYWVEVLFLRVLSRVTCMHRQELNNPVPQHIHDSLKGECDTNLLQANGKPEGECMVGIKFDVNQNGAQIPKSVMENIHFIRQDIEDKNKEEHTILQWKHVARVCDRCLLFIFSLFLICTTFGLIFRARGPEEHAHES